jgi:DMSO/TMAO reductase YedYZ heme-binding membrane subunit
MSEVMWYLTRSSGIVALALMLAAVADGLIFSGREGRRPRPAWWLDMHRGLGGYALAFTGLHLVTAFAASDLGVGLAQIFVPGAAPFSTAAFTWGVLSLYGLLVTVFSTWPRRLLRRGAWHAIHLLSIPAAVAAAIHAYQLGTDARTPAYTVLFLGFVGLAMYPMGLRLSGIARRRLHRDRTAVTTGVAR